MRTLELTYDVVRVSYDGGAVLVMGMARACDGSGTPTANDELCGAFCSF